MSIDRSSAQFAFRLIEAAEQHGIDSEPDHEVGDLQTFFVACWCVMTPQQRLRALDGPEVRDVLEGPEYTFATND